MLRRPRLWVASSGCDDGGGDAGVKRVLSCVLLMRLKRHSAISCRQRTGNLNDLKESTSCRRSPQPLQGRK